ncbi:unnamed protein product [Rotaria sordida]|uniref:Uncharacterized protein n=1 Tax=Rotaria sordida TaxID=392033 RepID=A0A815IV10_9BILA|nr:unnamed protein product [Rotaria sordida]
MATSNENSCNQQQNETLQYFDKIRIDLPWNQKDKNKSIDKIEPMEVGNLSQKMSQLSTNMTEKDELLLKDIKAEIEKIPTYLTKRNKSFLEIMNQALSKTAITTNTQPLSTTKLGDTTDSIDKLRKIAILIYKIMVIQTYQVLWAAYFKSGMGQLVLPDKTQVSYSINVPIWPKELKAVLASRNTDKTHENDTYLKFVNEQLDELDYQLKQCQKQLNIKANNFPGYTLTIQKILESYIEKNLHFLRMEIEHKVELIHYDYYIRALKFEYLRLQPNEYQECCMKDICQIKFTQETAEQEYIFLQQQINHYNSPNQLFDSSSIGSCSLIDSVEDQDIREEFYRQYKSIAEQSRTTLFKIYMKSAEEERKESKKKFDIHIQKMYSSHNALNENEKLTSIMIQLINERCQRISERIKCIYKFKSESLRSKP